MSRIRSLLGQIKRAGRRRFVPRGVILIYHRIAEGQIDPWRLCVSPENFASHLEVLRALGCKLVHASTLAEAVAERKLDPRTVAVTFDDGYHDNLEGGRPVLERYDAPATLFASAGYIGQDQEFWWDVVERIFLEAGLLPEVLELTVNGDTHRWELGSAVHFSEQDASLWPDWKPFRDPPTMRHHLHDELWRILFRSAPAERNDLIATLFRWAGVEGRARSNRRPLTQQELRQLRGEGLVEIGGHGMTHTALASLPSEVQANELRDSKTRLEELLEAPVLGCSYPQGGSSSETEAQVRRAGYAYACGSDAHSVKPESNPFHLPRVSVGNWKGTKFRSFIEGHLAA